MFNSGSRGLPIRKNFDNHMTVLNELLKRFSEIDVAQEKQEIEQNVQPYPVGLRPTGPVNLNVSIACK